MADLVICGWSCDGLAWRALPRPNGNVRVEWSLAGRPCATEADLGWVRQFDASRDELGYLHVTWWFNFDADVNADEAAIVGRAQYEIQRAQSVARNQRARAATERHALTLLKGGRHGN